MCAIIPITCNNNINKQKNTTSSKHTQTADIPVVVKPVANMMMLATPADAAKFTVSPPTTLASRWDSCPEALGKTIVGVQWFYEL